MKITNSDSLLATIKKLPLPFYLFLLATSSCYAGINGFYPNLSKFFQQRFNYNNEEAARIIAAPYMLGSIVTPLFGWLLSTVGPIYFENIMLLSVALLFSVHGLYYLMPSGEGNILCILPILIFGMASSGFSVCH